MKKPLSVLKKIGGREAKTTTQSSIKVTRRCNMTQTIAKTCTLMIILMYLCRYNYLLFMDSHYRYRINKSQAEQGSCHAIIGAQTTRLGCQDKGLKEKKVLLHINLKKGIIKRFIRAIYAYIA